MNAVEQIQHLPAQQCEVLPYTAETLRANGVPMNVKKLKTLKRQVIEDFLARAFEAAEKFGVTITYGRGNALQVDLDFKHIHFKHRDEP